MSVPSSFYLETPNPNQRPAPFPPRFVKRQIYNDPSVFKVVDEHAINEARTNYRNFRELMWNLVFKKQWNDLERARVIFRWMTTKNLFTIMFDSELPGSPEQVLGAFKDGKTTYAKIFECLTSYAGLHSVTLSGWAKGVDYKPGMPITTTPPNHSWNAVCVDGNWQLVDCHWATRYLQSERNTPENLVYEYDDFYFLTEPSMLVYSHLPEEPSWQLLHPVRSRTEYEEYPLVKSFFFSIGMQFLQQNRGLVFTRRGVATITLGFTRPTAFTFKLAYGEGNIESLQGVPLKRYIIQETTDDRVTFYFRSPREGNYYITVFAQAVADKLKIENVFKAACEYKIICDQAASDVRPYPQCSDANWGAGAPVRTYGLSPSARTALISVPNGRYEVAFQKTRDVRLFARLVKDGLSEEVLENAVDIREQDNRDVVAVLLPGAGEYGLEVYANEPIREGDTYTHVCQYLLSFSDKDFVATYGQVFDRSDLVNSMEAPPTMYNTPGGQFNTLSAAGPGRMAPKDQGRPSPGGSGRYPTQEWDANQYPGQQGQGYRDELGGGDGPMYRGNQMGPNMGPGGQRQGPSTGLKPGQKGYGSDYPPDTMNQAYQQQNRNPGAEGYDGYDPGRSGYGPKGSKENLSTDPKQNQGTYGRPNQPGQAYGQTDDSPKKPLEIVYVSNITEKNPQTGTGYKKPIDSAAEDAKKKPVEIVYVQGGANQGTGRSPMPAKKGIDDKSSPSQSPLTTKKGDNRSVAISGSKNPSGLNQNGGKIEDDRENFPPPPPTNMSTYPNTTSKNTGGPDGRTGQTGHAFVPADKSMSQGGAPGGVSKYGTGPGNQQGYGANADPAGDRKGYEGAPGGAYKYGTGPSNQPGYGSNRGPDNSQEQFDPRTGGTSYQPVSYPFGGDSTETSDQYSRFGPTEPEQEYKPHPQKVYTSSITMKAPSSFRLFPVEQDVALMPAPPSVPPKPFKDVTVFQNVDLHAVEVSKEEHKSFRDLVWHLIYAREITNELEKARAIFLWLCSKDLTKLNFDSVQRDSPEEILMNLQRGLTTYAVVYEILCSYAGLHCKTLSGYAKGAEYKPGMKFTGEQGQHSWNAVLVNGAWRLVDCHWAARRLVGKKVTAENVRYELDEYYFMPDPHQLIFTHFPDDVSWQLLDRSITLADFENLVPVKSAFFKYGLQILGHREAVIHARQEVTVRIGCPPFKVSSLAFTFTLTTDDGVEEFKGMKLNRFGMQEMVDNVSYFTIRPPVVGSYRFIIYAKDLDQQTKEGVYGGVCEYELRCEASPPRPMPFPPCVHTSWGPGDSCTKYNLTPLQKGAIFSTVSGMAEVRFQVSRELRFTVKLKSNESDEKQLAGFVMHRVVNDVAVFTISAPARGEYGLEIYANDPSVDGNSLYHTFQYLILCDEDVKGVEPLPFLPAGYLGPQPTFRKLGLIPGSHPDPYIQTLTGALQVSLSCSTPTRVTSQLIYASNNRSDDQSDYVLQQSRPPTSTQFFVRLPRTGLYKLQLYALPYDDPSENLPGVYNYLIGWPGSAAPISPATPFPKQYGQWKEGCYLYEPLDGLLPRQAMAKHHFKVEVPRANSVAVVVGDDWTQLEAKGGIWEGDASIEPHRGKETKVALCANYEGAKASYSTLLEYSI